MIKRSLQLIVLTIFLLAGHVASVYFNWFGNHEGPGEVTETPLPAEIIAKRESAQAAVHNGDNKQILFGDMHVHTTLSRDAFIMSLPLVQSQGQGAHPPADACDFARYCSGMDFWGISDHAEGLTPRRWREIKESVRQCNAVAGDPENPDMVTFTGWEWSQAGNTAAEHYGHKNIFFPGTAEDQLPTRAIASKVGGLPAQLVTIMNTGLSLLQPTQRQRYYDHQLFLWESEQTAPCEENISSPELPADCVETAETPELLNKKLDEWGYDSLIIPHGNAWGITAPQGADFASQLNDKMHNPERQSLIEVFSGHGNSEEYRSWREVSYVDGSASCPEPMPGFLPGCYRAGEIIYQRCADAGASAEICKQRELDARQNYVDAGLLKGFLTVPGASLADWGASDQCEDCFLPAYNYIPRSTAQYALALTNFDKPENPMRYRFGFIGSSDNHTGYPGTGYKEFKRYYMTESRPTTNKNIAEMFLYPNRGEVAPESIPAAELPRAAMLDRERYASFSLTGGLIAVHSQSRRREDIWQGMKQKEVYATSGPQILLWFDLLNGDKTLPMGSETVTETTPTFRVKALGAFKQNSGCPDYAVGALGADRIDSLCHGECFNPADERRQITRIEVIRIRPQQIPHEPVDGLIEDHWKTFDCPADGNGCEIEFSDEDFSASARDTVYYVRAIQEPTEIINGEPFACEEYSDQGQCLHIKPCNEFEAGECLGEGEERAWSSPIFVDFSEENKG